MTVWTNSRDSKFSECPQAHHLQYVNKYRLVNEDSAALNFGSAFHWLREIHYVNQMQGADLHPKIADLHTGQGSQLDPYEAAKVQALFDGWVARWADDPSSILAVEPTWEAPLVHPITGEAHPRVRLSGKIDDIRAIGGRTLNGEMKTTSEDIGPGSTYWERKRLDTQISLYYRGASVLGYEVDACLYDVAKKPGQRPKKMNKTNKADETPEEFHARIVEDIAADPSQYYARAEIVRTQAELDKAMLDLWERVTTWEWMQSQGIHPRVTGNCFKWGRACPYYQHCTGDVPVDTDPRFRIVDNEHPELAGA